MVKKILTINRGNASKTVNDLIHDFIRQCKVKSLSEHTLAYYKEVLDIFLDFLGDDTNINNINCDVVEEYTLALQKRNGNNVSVNTRLRGLRAYLYWCMKKGYCSQFKISLVREGEVIKSTFTDAELRELLKKPPLKTCTFSLYRDWGMVNFLLATGVRASTLANVKIADIDLEQQIIYIRHSKNRKQQIIPITNTLAKVLMEYLDHRNHSSNDDYLFPTQYGQQLCARGCEQAIRKYGKRRGVDNCGLHKFRHTFARNWILAGGDPFRLQKILGHSSLDIVKRYVSIYGHDLKKDYEKFNVLERVTEPTETIKMKKDKKI